MSGHLFPMNIRFERGNGRKCAIKFNHTFIEWFDNHFDFYHSVLLFYHSIWIQESRQKCTSIHFAHAMLSFAHIWESISWRSINFSSINLHKSFKWLDSHKSKQMSLFFCENLLSFQMKNHAILKRSK